MKMPCLRVATMLLITAALALPATAAPTGPAGWLARTADQVQSLVARALALVWPGNVEPASAPSRFCNIMDPNGCLSSTAPPAPPEPAGAASGFCNIMDPGGCAPASAPAEPPAATAGGGGPANPGGSPRG